MSPRVQDPIPRIGLSHGDTAMAPTVGSGEPSGRATGEPGGTAEGDDNITEHGAKRSVGASRAGGEPTRRVCEPDLDNSIVKSAMGVCEPDSANAASERGVAAATHQMADAPRETEQGQVCETNPDPTRAYLIPDSLRETLRCVELLLLPHPVPQELPSLDPITITQAVRDSRKLLGTDIVYDEEFYLTQNIPDIEPHHFEANDAALLNGQSLESILEAAITGKKLQGLQADKLREFLLPRRPQCGKGDRDLDRGRETVYERWIHPQRRTRMLNKWILPREETVMQPGLPEVGGRRQSDHLLKGCIG